MANSIPESAKILDKPPDSSFTISSGEKKMSFRDIMLTNSQPTPVRNEDDFLAEGLAHVNPSLVEDGVPRTNDLDPKA
ncbi:hypothetical protein Lal_00042616 [Lupinus albus]|nr:hypothetical protein Lal_00042616 [Lupinus albus]